MRYIRWAFIPLAIFATFTLYIDAYIVFDAFKTGERLHPQLAEHWPWNILMVCVLWFIVFRKSETTQ